MLRTGIHRAPRDAVMPFEPLLIAHDTVSRDGDGARAGDGQERLAARARVEAEEFDSPVLQALAVQLGDDADYLAQLYPPRAVPTRPLEGRRGWSTSTTGRWRVAAILFCFVGTATALGVWGFASRGDSLQVALAIVSSASQPLTIGAGTLTPATNYEPSGVATRSPYSIAAAAALRDANVKHVFSDSNFSGLEPGDLLQELSVSEQEAVFDLLESEPIELARISL